MLGWILFSPSTYKWSLKRYTLWIWTLKHLSFVSTCTRYIFQSTISVLHRCFLINIIICKFNLMHSWNHSLSFITTDLCIFFFFITITLIISESLQRIGVVCLSLDLPYKFLSRTIFLLLLFILMFWLLTVLMFPQTWLVKIIPSLCYYHVPNLLKLKCNLIHSLEEFY